eukprot:scaffold4850_cov213-Pinguiococcus_pyrenoidosus.AAC.28
MGPARTATRPQAPCIPRLTTLPARKKHRHPRCFALRSALPTDLLIWLLRRGTSRQDRGGQVSPTTANGSDGWASSASTGAGGKSASDRQYAAQQAALAAEKVSDRTPTGHTVQTKFSEHSRCSNSTTFGTISGRCPTSLHLFPPTSPSCRRTWGQVRTRKPSGCFSPTPCDSPPLQLSRKRSGEGSPSPDWTSPWTEAQHATRVRCRAVVRASCLCRLRRILSPSKRVERVGMTLRHSSALSAPGQFAGHGVNDFFGASTALPQPWSDQRGSRAADTPSSIRSVDSVSSFSKEQMLPASVGSLSDKGLPDHESGGRDLLTMDSGAVDGPSLRRHEQSQVDVMHDEYIRQLLVRANTNADTLSEEEIQVLQAKMAYQAAIERNLKSRVRATLASLDRSREVLTRFLPCKRLRAKSRRRGHGASSCACCSSSK